MRLDFKVLLIDDQPTAVSGAMESLKLHVEEEGFRLQITPARTVEAAVGLLADNVWADGIDLVLVDFDLGSGSGGERALPRIRSAMPYKEVVFYSARETSYLRERACEAGVDGVYCASRVTLGEAAKAVFDTLVRKVIDIDHCRGIIVGATSDLDYVVNDILRALDSQLPNAERNAALQWGLERIDAAIERYGEKRDNIAKNPTLEALLEDTQLFTSSDRLRLLIRFHDCRFGASKPLLRRMIGQYLDRMLPIRNMFGHMPLKPGDSHKALNKYEDQTVNPQTLRSVRRELLSFRDQFLELAALAGCETWTGERDEADQKK